MSQNKTTTKKTSTPTSLTKSKVKRTTTPPTDNSEEAVSDALEATPTESMASDVPITGEGIEAVALAKNEETADTETYAVSEGTEVTRRTAPYENDDYLGEVVGFIDFAAAEDEPQADDAAEPSTSSDTEVDIAPFEEAGEADAVHAPVNEPQSTDVEIELLSEAPLVTEDVNPQTASETKPPVGAEKPTKKVKGLDHRLRTTSAKYLAACKAVSDLRLQFISALDAKAGLLNTQRRGEAVPVRNDEIDAIEQEIRVAKETLLALQKCKRELRSTSPELDKINHTIRELSRQRNSARAVKQKIFEEEVGQLAAQSVGASATL